MTEPAYKKARKRQLVKDITDFIISHMLPDYIDYQTLDDLKSDIESQTEDQGEIGAFCDHFGLGSWFEDVLSDCDFCVEDFYAEYAKEIEWRAKE